MTIGDTTPATSAVAIVCDLDALTAAEREQQQQVTRVLGAVLEEVSEHADGYALRYPVDASTLGAAAALIALERRCCPFIDFELAVRASGRSFWLRLSGPAGTKGVLAGSALLEPKTAAKRE